MIIICPKCQQKATENSTFCSFCYFNFQEDSTEEIPKKKLSINEIKPKKELKINNKSLKTVSIVAIVLSMIFFLFVTVVTYSQFKFRISDFKGILITLFISFLGSVFFIKRLSKAYNLKIDFDGPFFSGFFDRRKENNFITLFFAINIFVFSTINFLNPMTGFLMPTKTHQAYIIEKSYSSSRSGKTYYIRARFNRKNYKITMPYQSWVNFSERTKIKIKTKRGLFSIFILDCKNL